MAQFLQPETRHGPGSKDVSKPSVSPLLWPYRLMALDSPLPPVASVQKNAFWGLGLHIVVMAHHIVCTFIKVTHGQEAVELCLGGVRGER